MRNEKNDKIKRNFGYEMVCLYLHSKNLKEKTDLVDDTTSHIF